MSSKRRKTIKQIERMKKSGEIVKKEMQVIRQLAPLSDYHAKVKPKKRYEDVEAVAEDYEIKIETSQNQESKLSGWMPSGFVLNSRNKVNRCLKCNGCLNHLDNYTCDKCKYCLDSPRLGGQNSLKLTCEFRWCVRNYRKASEADVERRVVAKPQKLHHKLEQCGKCNGCLNSTDKYTCDKCKYCLNSARKYRPNSRRWICEFRLCVRNPGNAGRADVERRAAPGRIPRRANIANCGLCNGCLNHADKYRCGSCKFCLDRFARFGGQNRQKQMYSHTCELRLCVRTTGRDVERRTEQSTQYPCHECDVKFIDGSDFKLHMKYHKAQGEHVQQLQVTNTATVSTGQDIPSFGSSWRDSFQGIQSQVVVASPGMVQPKLNKKPMKDPNAPKKPLSSYFLFSQEERLKVLKENPVYSITDVAKELGRRWRMLDPGLKVIYDNRAMEARKVYDYEMEQFKAQKNMKDPCSPNMPLPLPLPLPLQPQTGAYLILSAEIPIALELQEIVEMEEGEMENKVLIDLN